MPIPTETYSGYFALGLTFADSFNNDGSFASLRDSCLIFLLLLLLLLIGCSLKSCAGSPPPLVSLFPLFFQLKPGSIALFFHWPVGTLDDLSASIESESGKLKYEMGLAVLFFDSIIIGYAMGVELESRILASGSGRPAVL